MIRRYFTPYGFGKRGEALPCQNEPFPFGTTLVCNPTLEIPRRQDPLASLSHIVVGAACKLFALRPSPQSGTSTL
jgi:hypothetical protein